MQKNIGRGAIQTPKPVQTSEIKEVFFDQSDAWFFKKIIGWREEFPPFSPEKERSKLEKYCALRDTKKTQAPIEIELEEMIEGSGELEKESILRKNLGNSGEIQVELRSQMRLIEEEFTYRNIGLVFKCYMKYKYHVAYSDRVHLLQEGFIGILLALRRFELEKGEKFSTYAIPWIRRQMRIYIAKYSRTIHVPRYMYFRLGEVKKILYEESILRQHELSDSEIQEILTEQGYGKKPIKSILSAMRTKQVSSLDYGHTDDEEIVLYDHLPDVKTSQGYEKMEEHLDFQETSKKLLKVCLRRNARDFGVLMLLSGIYGAEKTWNVVGKIYDISRQRVYQIRDQIRKSLRNDFNYLNTKDISNEELSKYITDYCELPLLLYDELSEEEYKLICYRFGIAICNSPQTDSEIAERFGIKTNEVPLKIGEIMEKLKDYSIDNPFLKGRTTVIKYLMELSNPRTIFESEFYTVLRRMFYKSHDILTVLKDKYGVTVFKGRDFETLSQEFNNETVQTLKKMFEDTYVRRRDQEIRFMDYLDRYVIKRKKKRKEKRRGIQQ